MPRGKKFTAEQIIGKLREAEVGFAQGENRARGGAEAWGDRADVLPVEAGVRRPADGPGEAVAGGRACAVRVTSLL